MIKHLLSDYLEDLADAEACDAALAELASGKDDTISLAEWEQRFSGGVDKRSAIHHRDANIGGWRFAYPPYGTLTQYDQIDMETVNDY